MYRLLHVHRDESTRELRYIIENDNGIIRILGPSHMREELEHGLDVKGLRLISKGIEVSPNKNKGVELRIITEADKEKELTKVRNLIAKLKLVDTGYREISTLGEEKCILVSKDKLNHYLYIPDKVKQLRIESGKFNGLRGKLSVIGGNDLTDIRRLFEGSHFAVINIEYLNTSKVQNMEYLFAHSKTSIVQGLENLDTSTVWCMEGMFLGCKFDINLSKWNNNPELKTIDSMFFKCKSRKVNLNGFDTSKVKDAQCMFMYCNIRNLDISNLNLSNCVREKSMDGMFTEAKIERLKCTNIDKKTILENGENIRIRNIIE